MDDYDSWENIKDSFERYGCPDSTLFNALHSLADVNEGMKNYSSPDEVKTAIERVIIRLLTAESAYRLENGR